MEARYRGRGTKFYKGKVTRINSDGTLDIDYDDGEKEVGITAEHVRSLESPQSDGDGRGGGRRSRDNKLSRGDAVEARYRSKGTKFYKGKISRVNADGTFDIAYDDGEREIGMAEEHVRSLEKSERDGGGDRNAGRGDRSEGRGGGGQNRSPPREGDRVEGNYRGRGKYYKGRIARVNLDGTFNIDYDDGEKERGVSEANVCSVGGEAASESRTNGRGNRKTGALQRGDRVEARYRGRGTKFYKGKIKRVNSDETFDIDYDDGEKELGIAAEHVVSLEQPTTGGGGGGGGRNGRGGRDDRSDTLQEGDKVEGNYRGRGRFYKGTISRVNLDGTFNIDYDDGEKERGIADDMIRKERGGSGRDNASRAKLQRGDRVEARYRGKGTKFYKGKIARVNSDGTFDVDYDDGEKEIGIAEEHVVSLEPKSEKPIGRAILTRGDRVEARYRGRGTKFYKGKIARVNSDGTFDINYDDGEKELGIAEEHVTSLESSGARGGGDGGSGAWDRRDRGGNNNLGQGDRVEARYRGRGTKFYKGKIVRVNSNDTFDIAYDDGEKEIGIAEEHVRSLETAGRAGRAVSTSRAPTLSEGDKVEANFRRRGRFFTGRISRVNLDGTFNVDYDDGEKERGITDDLIRPLLDRGGAGGGRGEGGRGGVRGGGGRLQEGDKVEARYRGRGTKFYKGTIVRVNSDATFDIDYDDGEKERGIAEEHVRAVDGDRSSIGRGGGGRGHDAGAGLVEEGDKVEANYRGRGRYYKGRVRRVNRDGTYDIDYDDGEKERGVPTDMVRATNEAGKPDRGAHSGGGSSRLLKGDTVEARYRGRGTKFYKGRIVRVNSDDTFDIDYDDGEKERGIAEEHVRPLGDSRVSAHDRDGTRNNSTIIEGDKVEANYRGSGRYYKGVINRTNRDGTFDVDYDDGEKEKNVRQSMIRALDSSMRAAQGRGGGSGPLKRGDRVEARYRGRGTKFYKGKVVRINSDATLDIDYDDGEKEIGIDEEHVRPLETEMKESSNSRSRSGSMLEGDNIEANYRGRGRFYKGRISRVNLDGTFNIDYDDGEKERGVTDDLIRALDGGGSSSGGGGGGGVGRGRSTSPTSRLKAIAGRVTARDTSDGDVGGGGKLKRGDAVEARYRGKGSKFYKGKIARVNSDATFDIDYDDGDKERSIRGEHVRPLASSAAESSRDRRATATARQGKLHRGDRVEARYRGRGTKFFSGRISRVNSDDTLDIDYDDGDKEVGIGEEHVRPLGRPRNGGGGGGDGSDDGLRDQIRNLREGDNVEANYRGRGRYYKGRIRRVNSNGTFDVDYDDGEKERDVAKGSIRGAAKYVGDDLLPIRRDRRGSEDKPSPGRGGSRRGSVVGGGGGGTRLQRGDKVEARYRGRGTKFYKGRIARVNPDGTFDIDYDDGEKEIGISEEHVRSLEPGAAGAGAHASPGRGGRSSTNDREGYDDGDASPRLLEGDRVESNYQGRGRYYAGRISRLNLDGSFNIDYDDGEKERGVSRGMVRPVDAVPRGGVTTGRRGSHNTRGTGGRSGGTRLQRGDRVEARYRGRGTKFYAGRVARVNSDATLDIDYDDGDKEVGIAEEHVREAA